MAVACKNKSRKIKENEEEIKDGLSGRIFFPPFLKNCPQILEWTFMVYMEHNVPKHILAKRLGRCLLEHDLNSKFRSKDKRICFFAFRQIGLVSVAEPEDRPGTEVLTQWMVGGARTSSTSISGVFLHATLHTLILWTTIIQFDHPNHRGEIILLRVFIISFMKV